MYDEKENSVLSEKRELEELIREVTEEEKRELRRQKRKKSQLIARLSMILFLVFIIVVGIIGISFLKSKIQLETLNEEELIVEEQIQQEEQETVIAEIEEIVQEEQIENDGDIDVLDEVVESIISEMTLEEKVAGIFLVTPEHITGVDVAVQAGEGTKKALEQYPIGGLIYFSKNIKSGEQIKEMIEKSVSYSKYPMFIAVDEEGGDVARFANGLNLKNPGPMSEIGKTNDPSKAKEAMAHIGAYLKEYGVTLNLAPVADVLNEEGEGILKNRSFGKDPVMVSNMVVASLEGLKENNIIGCIKHFPGIGESIEDTHKEMSVVDRTKEDLYGKELIPFVAAIESGVEMIMVREELGFNGVVITDAMNMAAVTEYYGADEAAIKALKAGADMVLMPEDFELAYQGVLDAVVEGTISEERIEDGLRRIYRIKYKDFVGN